MANPIELNLAAAPTNPSEVLLEGAKLTSPIKNIDLLPPPERDDLLEEEFKNRLNLGLVFPVGVPLEQPNSKPQIEEFERQVTVASGSGPKMLTAQLEYLFRRFTPGIAKKSREEYDRQFARFMAARGYNGQNQLDEQIRQTATVVYFPIGLGTDGKLAVQKIYYPPQHLQAELMSASAWELVPPPAQKVLRECRATVVGLSVGFRNLMSLLALGVGDFDLLDPGVLHADMMGRMEDSGYGPKWHGVNKAMIALFAVMRRNPYAKIRVVPDGLTQANYPDIFDQKLLSKVRIDVGGRWFISEEVDLFSGKSLSRKGPRQMKNIPWDLVMIGDVGHRATYFYEHAEIAPFQGIFDKLIPGDIYGQNYVQQNDNLLALFASVGGFTGIPEELLSMIQNRRIGEFERADIARVPQTFGTTALTQALSFEVFKLIATGVRLKPFGVFDLHQGLVQMEEKKYLEMLARERKMQQEMNQAMFGISDLL